ncbi:MAG: BatD family protein [Pseudomonadota bacterium]
MKSIVKPLIVFFFLAGPSFAFAGISVTLKLDRDRAAIHDPVRVVVTVLGTQKAGSEPTINGLEDFDVAKGGSASRVEITGGVLKASIEYTYFIQAKKTGTFQIGPAQVEVAGEVLESNKQPLTISEAPPNGPDASVLFLSGTLSKGKAYLGEQIQYSLKLYRRIKVSGISLELPGSENIRLIPLGRPVEYQTEREGREYWLIEFRYAIIPAREGKHLIQPFRMDLIVYEPGRGLPRGFFHDPFFDLPFLARGRPVKVESDPFELEVVPLPESGRPSDFSGLVGSFKIESALSRSRIKVGESAALTINISGTGNIDHFPFVETPKISHVKVYAHEPALIIDPGSTELSGTQVMKWVIVPEMQGEYKIPPQSISFFDPETRQYRIVQSSTHTLLVLPPKGKMIMVKGDGHGFLEFEYSGCGNESAHLRSLENDRSDI